MKKLLESRPIRYENVWYILENDKILTTPAGNPIGSTRITDIEKVIEEIKLYGTNPSDGWTLYALLCSYMDFCSSENYDMLLGKISDEIESDPLYQDAVFAISMGLDLSEYFPPAIFQFLNERHIIALLKDEIAENRSGIDLTLLKRTIFTYIALNYSMKGVMAITYFTSHFNSPLCCLAYLKTSNTRAAIRKYLKNKIIVWPFPPDDFVKSLKMLSEFAKLEDDRDEVIKVYSKIKA